MSDIVERLNKRTVRRVPANWQDGRECPECGVGANRPKCFYDMGGSCPRHDPDNYEPSPYVTAPDPVCAEAASTITALRQQVERAEHLLAAAQFAAGELERGNADLAGSLASLTQRVKEAVEPFSKIAGAMFSRNWNASEHIITLTHPVDGVTVKITAGDFFKMRLLYNEAVGDSALHDELTQETTDGK